MPITELKRIHIRYRIWGHNLQTLNGSECHYSHVHAFVIKPSDVTFALLPDLNVTHSKGDKHANTSPLAIDSSPRLYLFPY